MRAWYDVSTFDDLLQTTADETGILRSQQIVHALVRAETAERGIAPQRIVLGGFSQGGCLALFAGLTSPVRLGGIFALSSYLLIPKRLRELFLAANNSSSSSGSASGSGSGSSSGAIRSSVAAAAASVASSAASAAGKGGPAAGRAPPIFMGHGDQDPLIEHEWGMQTASILREWGLSVDFRTYRYKQTTCLLWKKKIIHIPFA